MDECGDYSKQPTVEVFLSGPSARGALTALIARLSNPEAVALWQRIVIF